MRIERNIKKKVPIGKRVFWADTVKCFAIFLVLWGHSIQHLHPSDYSDNVIYKFIYSFHMPLFMIVSGYFAVNISRNSWTKFIVKKTYQLLLPTLIPTIICCFIVFYKGEVFGFEFDNIPLFAIGAVWFLKSLFLCYCIYYIVLKFQKYKVFALLASIIFCVTIPHHFFQLDIMYPCFIIGTYLNIYKRTITEFLSPFFFISIIIFALSFLFDITSLLRHFLYKLNISASHDSQSFSYLSKGILYYIPKIYIIIQGTLGSLSIISFFILVEHPLSNTKIGYYISQCGTMTLGIYILQTIMLEILIRELFCFNKVDTYVFSIFLAPIISIFILYGCVEAIIFLRRNKYLSLLFLGEKK